MLNPTVSCLRQNTRRQAREKHDIIFIYRPTTMQPQQDSATCTSPPPLTSVLLALRSESGTRISALPRVIEAISGFVDSAALKSWTIQHAYEANFLSLLQRLAWHVARNVAAGAVDPFYWKYQCRLGFVAAVKHGNLAVVEWLNERYPHVVLCTAMIEAARSGPAEDTLVAD